MPLIKCPDCSTTVSDRADKCPNCHCPIASENKKNIENVKIVEKNSEGCFLQTLNFGCVAGLVLLALIIILPLLASLFS